MSRYARDESQDPIAELMMILDRKLTVTDFAEAEKLLQQIRGRLSNDIERAGGAPSWEGAPQAGANDAARYSFDSRDAGRVVADREVAIEECARHVDRTVLLACDSATSVFRAALRELGHDPAGTHASALPVLFRAHARNKQTGTRVAPRFAEDAAARQGFAGRFPDAAKVRLS